MNIDLIAFCLFYIVVLFPRWRKRELFFHTICYIYLVSVFMLTLSPCIMSLRSIFSHHYQPMLLEPFRDILSGYAYADIQIILNIILFIPFGFLMSKVKQMSKLKVVFYSFVLSLCIELIQPLLSVYRYSDITDIICNTLGGFIGCLLFGYIKR